MSISIQSIPTAVGVFQAHFGALPGSQDPKAECEKWERLCGELLAERARLKAELEQLRLDQITREWAQIPVPSWEEMQAQIDRSTTLEQIIADLKAEAEADNAQR
jgi:hypothetical protein